MKIYRQRGRDRDRENKGEYIRTERDEVEEARERLKERERGDLESHKHAVVKSQTL